MTAVLDTTPDTAAAEPTPGRTAGVLARTRRRVRRRRAARRGGDRDDGAAGADRTAATAGCGGCSSASAALVVVRDGGEPAGAAGDHRLDAGTRAVRHRASRRRRRFRRPASCGLMLRELAHLLDTAALFIGWLWPLWDRRRRTFADLLLRTEVHGVEPAAARHAPAGRGACSSRRRCCARRRSA